MRFMQLQSCERSRTFFILITKNFTFLLQNEEKKKQKRKKKIVTEKLKGEEN
jgi:preprotein translocase subunit YajC